VAIERLFTRPLGRSVGNWLRCCQTVPLLLDGYPHGIVDISVNVGNWVYR